MYAGKQNNVENNITLKRLNLIQISETGVLRTLIYFEFTFNSNILLSP